MQITCFKCQMPFSLSRDELFSALDVLADQNLTRYDLRCPKCRKTNRVSRKQLRRAAPTWKRDREETLPESE